LRPLGCTSYPLTQFINVIQALDMNEHVSTALIRGDKSIAFIGVKIDDGPDPSGHSLLLAQ
jgi:hypothetical protein